MSRSIRLTPTKIYFNNTEVDDVYYNNEHIWPPTPFLYQMMVLTMYQLVGI